MNRWIARRSLIPVLGTVAVLLFLLNFAAFIDRHHPHATEAAPETSAMVIVRTESPLTVELQDLKAELEMLQDELCAEAELSTHLREELENARIEQRLNGELRMIAPKVDLRFLR